MLTYFRQERASEQYPNNSVNGLLLLNTNTAIKIKVTDQKYCLEKKLNTV